MTAGGGRCGRAGFDHFRGVGWGDLVTPSHPGKSPSHKAVTGIFLHLILTVDVELC